MCATDGKIKVKEERRWRPERRERMVVVLNFGKNGGGVEYDESDRAQDIEVHDSRNERRRGFLSNDDGGELGGAAEAKADVRAPH
jgi:hypothetical protein